LERPHGHKKRRFNHIRGKKRGLPALGKIPCKKGKGRYFPGIKEKSHLTVLKGKKRRRCHRYPPPFIILQETGEGGLSKRGGNRRNRFLCSLRGKGPLYIIYIGKRGGTNASS